MTEIDSPISLNPLLLKELRILEGRNKYIISSWVSARALGSPRAGRAFATP
jgi:hypothetical protein